MLTTHYQRNDFNHSSTASTALLPLNDSFLPPRQIEQLRLDRRSSNFGSISRAIEFRQTNRRPVDLRISQTRIDENALPNSPVGKLRTLDPDRKNTFKYKLIPIAGIKDHTAFKVVRDQVQLKTAIDFEKQASYNIKLRTTDQGGLFYDKKVGIYVNDIFESPPPSSNTPFVAPSGTVRQEIAKYLRIDQWEATMKSKASQVYDALINPNASSEQKLAETNYDGESVFTDIAEYLNDPQYYTYAQAAGDAYQKYVLNNQGNVPGYWNFTSGLTKRYLRTGDPNAKKAVQLLANNAAFARDSTPLEWTQSYKLSREVANAIEAYLNAELVGEPPRFRLNNLVDQALDHLNQWFGTKTAPYVKSFMVGLTANVLIDYQKQKGDSRIVGALTQAMDGLWISNWDKDAQAFKYVDRAFGTDPDTNDTSPAPDLNLLIAPAYAWLYRQTGEIRFRDRGDQIFNGGVRSSWVSDGKHFNQNYLYSINYVKWRTEGQTIWGSR